MPNNLLTHKSDWCGGRYLLDGDVLDVSAKPKATLEVGGRTYDVEYHKVNGEDYDHGTVQRWTKIAIGVTVSDGTLSCWVSAEDIFAADRQRAVRFYIAP